jgi:hypothetical protein
MSWRGQSELTDAALAEVAGALELAAAAAPPSPRAAAIRAELLASLEADRRAVPLLRPLAIAVVVLLTAAIVIGAPLVGSFIERLDDLPPPLLPTPLPTADPSPSESAAAEVSPSPSPSPSPESTLPVESTEPGAVGPTADPTFNPATTPAPGAPENPAAQPTPTDNGVAEPAAPPTPAPTPAPTPEPTPEPDEDPPCIDLPLLPCIPLPILPPILPLP